MIAIALYNNSPMALMNGFRQGDPLKKVWSLNIDENDFLAHGLCHETGIQFACRRLFDILNGMPEYPEGFKGRSMSVGDVAMVITDDSIMLFACEKQGWKSITRIGIDSPNTWDEIPFDEAIPEAVNNLWA